ncbi:hypothetical protein PTKIN_Ptkin09bG0218300 [Pterospermum kingtungense]
MLRRFKDKARGQERPIKLSQIKEDQLPCDHEQENHKALEEVDQKHAKAMGIEQNFKGEGEIKGGLFIVGQGGTGIAYQFIERNFGGWAPVAEVIEICARLQNHQQDQGASSKSPQEYRVK